MAEERPDFLTILRIVETVAKVIDEVLKLKEVIKNEIDKEKDAAKREKFWNACSAVLTEPSDENLAAFRAVLFDL